MFGVTDNKNAFFKVPQQETEETDLGNVESLQRSGGSVKQR